jgi:hypothetical protein
MTCDHNLLELKGVWRRRIEKQVQAEEEGERIIVDSAESMEKTGQLVRDHMEKKSNLLTVHR